MKEQQLLERITLNPKVVTGKPVILPPSVAHAPMPPHGRDG